MTHEQRLLVKHAQAYLVAHKAHCHYRQVRPMTTCHITTLAELAQAVLAPEGIEMDCSESVHLTLHIAGTKDPSGLDWNCYGDTKTMLDHLPRYYDARQAQPGALVVFNSDMPLDHQHIAQCHEQDDLHGNPVLFTDGGNGDPSFRTLSWLQNGFSGATTWLSVAHL